MSWVAQRVPDDGTGLSKRISSSIARGELRRVLDDAPPLLRMGREPRDQARQRRRHRVEPRDREHVHDVDDLVVVQAMAVDLEVDELVEQVVVACALGAPLGETNAELGIELGACGPADLLHLLHVPALVLEDAVLQVDEERRVLEREPEQPEEDRRRQRHAERVVELDVAVRRRNRRSARRRACGCRARAPPSSSARRSGRGACGSAGGCRRRGATG